MSEAFAPKVSEIAGQGMITLRGDIADPAFAEAVTSTTGLPIPEIRRIVEDGTRALAWMSPDEMLLLCATSEAPALVQALSGALSGQFATVADVSDARAVFEVSGPGCREVLAKLTPVDLHPDQFAPGELRRTRMAQVATALWMPDAGTIRLICFRSVAQYVGDLLTLSAAPGGQIRLFPDHAS